MKKIFAFIALITLFISISAVHAVTFTKKQWYLYHRYQTITTVNSEYYLDFEDISTIIKDADCTFVAFNNNKGDDSICNHTTPHVWAILKNGSTLHFDKTSNLITKYNLYREFLLGNPEYKSVP